MNKKQPSIFSACEAPVKGNCLDPDRLEPSP